MEWEWGVDRESYSTAFKPIKSSLHSREHIGLNYLKVHYANELMGIFENENRSRVNEKNTLTVSFV